MDADAIKKMLDGNVDAITVKLADLSVDQLGALKTAENEGGKRSTLLAAIDKQIEAAGAAKADEDAGEREGAVSANPAALRDPIDTDWLGRLCEGLEDRGLRPQGGENDDRDPVEVALATIDERQRLLDARDAEHRDQVSKLEAKANAKPSGAAKTKAGKVLSIDGKAAPFKLGELTGAKILFVDDEDRTIPAINPLEFSRSAFNPTGNRAVLARDVDFQADMPAAQVMGAFLMAGDKPVAKATLVQPFSVGGGRRARMPKGTLSFAGNSAPAATAKT